MCTCLTALFVAHVQMHSVRKVVYYLLSALRGYFLTRARPFARRPAMQANTATHRPRRYRVYPAQAVMHVRAAVQRRRCVRPVRIVYQAAAKGPRRVRPALSIQRRCNRLVKTARRAPIARQVHWWRRYVRLVVIIRIWARRIPLIVCLVRLSVRWAQRRIVRRGRS